MEPVQGEGDVSEVFLVLGPLEEALEHRPRVPCERRALGVGQPEVEAREHEPEIVAQLRGRVALGAQREGSDVERPRGRGGLPLQGLERRKHVAPAFGPHASGTALKKNDDPMTNVTLQAMAVACITYSLQWPCLLPTGSLANQAL